MKKSPEQYFQEQDFSAGLPEPAKPGEFSEAEKAFMEKYLGMDTGATLEKLGIAPPVPSAPATSAAPDVVAGAEALAMPETPVEEPLSEVLRREPELLMVGFFLDKQEFVVPTLAVQEVIRSAAPTKLPAAPRFVAGVINLRGKVTPLVRLRDLLDIPASEGVRDQFTIVCRRKGLQLGLMIERVHTMYRVPQADIDWGVETHLGTTVEFISGLLKLREDLVGIVSVDKIVETIITS